MRHSLAILLAITALTGAQAQTTYTWSKTGTAAWETATDWTPSGPPISSINALVDPSATTTMTLGSTANGITTNDTVDSLTFNPGAAFGLYGATVAGTNTTATDNLTVSGSMTKTGSTTTIRNSQSATNGVGDVNLDILGTFTGGSISFGSTSIALNKLTVGGLFTDNTVLAVNFNVTGADANLNGGLTMTGACTVNVDAAASSGGISTAFITGTAGTIDAYTATGSTGTLTINGTGTSAESFGGVLADGSAGSTLSLVMSGAFTQTLTGANTFSGGTTVNSGTLTVANTTGSGLGTGPVTVNSGGTLGGWGIIAPSTGNNISIAPGGTLSPGTSGAGTLTFTLPSANLLSFYSGSALNLTLNGSTSTSVNFTNSFNSLSGNGNYTLNLSGTDIQVNTPYNVFTHVNRSTFSPAAVTLTTSSGTTTLAGSSYTFGLNSAGTNFVITLLPPSITSQPVSQISSQAGTTSFTVAATGSDVTYEWYRNGILLSNGTQADGSVVSGANLATLSVSNIQPDEESNVFTCTITDAVSAVTSVPAALVAYATPASVTAQRLMLVFEGSPPKDDTSTYYGNPANWCDTGDAANLVSTKWTQGAGLLLGIWGNRRNWSGVTNDEPSLIATSDYKLSPNWSSGVSYVLGDIVQTSGPDYWVCLATNTSATPSENPAYWQEVYTNTVLTLAQPLPWAAPVLPEPNYIPGEQVLDANGSCYQCTLSPPTDPSPDPSSDPNHWEVVTATSNPAIVPPECRFEYSTFAQAEASNIVQTLYVTGAPPYTTEQSGYLDVAAAAGLTVYPYGEMVATASTIFNKRPLDPSSSGGTTEATNTPTLTSAAVFLPQYRLTDCWTDYALDFTSGGTWTAGQLVRYQQNLLPNDFQGYSAVVPDAGYAADNYTDDMYNQTDGDAPPQTTKNIANGSVTLAGAGASIYHRYLLSDTTTTDGNQTYQFTVTGVIAQPATGTIPGTVTLQVVGLADNGTELAGDPAPLTCSFNIPAPPADTPYGTFSVTQTFGTGTYPWPTGAAYLRFGVVANSSLPGSPEIQISSMLVQNANASLIPTYWRCQADTTAPAPGDLITTPAFVPNPAYWNQQQLGVELDYEVGDLRPSSDTENYNETIPGTYTGQNLVYLVQQIQAACQPEGYVSVLYTDDLDPNPLNTTAETNAFTNDNLPLVVAAVNYLVPEAGGDNYEGDSVINVATTDYDRVSGLTSFSSDHQLGFALELLHQGAQVKNGSVASGAIASVSYGTGTITVTAPTFSTGGIGHYVRINGLAGTIAGTIGALLNGHAFQVTATGSGGAFTFANPGSTTPAYAGGGVVSTGGSLVQDFADCRATLFNPSTTQYFEIWRNTAQETGYPQPNSKYPVSSAQIANAAISGSLVTMTMPGGDTFAPSSGLGYISGINAGMTELNGSVFLTTPSTSGSPEFSLSFTDGSGVGSGETQGGTVTDATGCDTDAKIAALVGDTMGPAITIQPPASVSESSGGGVTFTVAAFTADTSSPSYQWYCTGASGTVLLTDGSDISGAQTTTLTLSGLTTSDTGQYFFVVTDSTGSTTSTSAALTVNP